MAYQHYDVFVIGTGTAGKNVAQACVEAGLSVGIADNREYGGTCANRGCDPKKVLVGLAEILDRSEKMLGYGIQKMPEFSWEAIQEFKRKFVDKVPLATEEKLSKLGIDLYHQSPQFLDEHRLSVEGKTLTADKIVIATGNKAFQLPIPGAEHTLISDDFLSLPHLPNSMIFIGAGYIGMEFAHIAARCGVKVTVIDAESRPLLNFDKHLVKHLVEASEKAGIRFIFDAKVTAVEKLRKNFRVQAVQEGENINVKAELVFNTAGRVPSIDELNLEKGKVNFTSKGISVNQKLQNTGNPNVYACGDVTDSEGLALTPLSSHESSVVISQLLGNQPEEVSYPAQPSVVFTLPQLASIGFNEADAKAAGYSIEVEEKEVSRWFNSKRIRSRYYAYKTIVDKKTGYILGAHLLGPEAGETINLFALAMAGKLTHDALKQLIFAYPTWGNDIRGMV